MSIRISKVQFYCILFLILLMPALVKSELLLFGISTEGEVIDHEWITSIRGGSVYSIVRFKTETEAIEMRGPQNVEYEVGKKVKIIYDKNDHSNRMILSLSYIYLGRNAIIPGFLLLVWLAMYYAFRHTNKE